MTNLYVGMNSAWCRVAGSVPCALRYSNCGARRDGSGHSAEKGATELIVVPFWAWITESKTQRPSEPEREAYVGFGHVRGRIGELSGDGEIGSAVDESAVTKLEIESVGQFVGDSSAIQECGAIL